MCNSGSLICFVATLICVFMCSKSVRIGCDFDRHRQLCKYNNAGWDDWLVIKKHPDNPEDYAAIASIHPTYDSNATLISPNFTVIHNARCLKFDYRLRTYEDRTYPVLQIKVGNSTWSRAAFDRTGKWHREELVVDKTDEETEIRFTALSGIVYIDNVKLLTAPCRKKKTRSMLNSDDSGERIIDIETMGCDFETGQGSLCQYRNAGLHQWSRKGVCQNTAWGNVARVSVYDEEEAILQSPPFLVINNTSCIKFQYSLQAPHVIQPQLELEVGENRLYLSHQESNSWHDGEMNITQSDEEVRIRFIARSGTISIDNIVVQATPCGVQSTPSVVHSDHVDPWYEWTSWSECSCKPGSQQKTRECPNPYNDVIRCKGNKVETTECENECRPFDVLTPWKRQYLFFKETLLTHNEAKKFCCKVNATLAMLKSKPENRAVGDVLEGHYGSSRVQYHIGIRKYQGDWWWSDGELIGERTDKYWYDRPFEAWTSDDNNYNNSDYKCAALTSHRCRDVSYRNRGNMRQCWERIPCDSRKPFICEKEYNACTMYGSRCQNGATCVLYRHIFQCICPENYVGEYCGFARYPCTTLPCLNGGICRPDEAAPRRYTCLCGPGFSGYDCEFEPTYKRIKRDREYLFFSHPLLTHDGAEQHCAGLNGTLAMPKTLRIHKVIWAGIREIHGREVPWYRIGLRVHGRRSKWKWSDGTKANNRPRLNKLVTKRRFEVWSLDADHDPRLMCAAMTPSKCRNMSVTSNKNINRRLKCWNETSCDNLMPFVCEREVNPCSTAKCRNSGVCVAEGDSYRCECPAYEDDDCTILKDPCSSSPCLHGGRCTRDETKFGRYSCACPQGFIGLNCERSNSTTSCLGRCYERIEARNVSSTCFCDNYCTQHNTCCSDYTNHCVK